MPATPAACLSAVLLLAGCAAERQAASAEPEAPRVEELRLGPVLIEFVADPPRVHLDRDLLLTIRITAPAEIDIATPDLGDRLSGFSLAGFFAGEPADTAGKKTREYHARLTPLVAERYRMAPLAIEYTDRGQNPASTGWIATRPLEFEAAATPGSGGKVEPLLDPVWIRPSFTTVLAWTAGAVALAGLGILLWRLSRKVRREIQLRKLSPRERAMRELEELLGHDLIGRNMVKEFYLQLTMVVRRYIERRHGIRAPEQTTEEFLGAVQADARFGLEVVARLRDFLQAADLVKFAAYRPDRATVDQATATAREYITTDDAKAEERDGPGTNAR